MKWDFVTTFLTYDVQWRKHRKLLHEHLQVNAMPKYVLAQRQGAHNFLRHLLVTPDNFLHHTRQ